MLIENQIVLKAEEGKTITNGETFGKVVYLSKIDNAANWREITDEEAESMKQDDNLMEVR